MANAVLAYWRARSFCPSFKYASARLECASAESGYARRFSLKISIAAFVSPMRKWSLPMMSTVASGHNCTLGSVPRAFASCWVTWATPPGISI